MTDLGTMGWDRLALEMTKLEMIKLEKVVA
jgi:hypothetical protein